MLFHQFTQYIEQHKLFHPKDRLLLAVSGGIDSVVLCHLCSIAGYNFAIMHCNFQLRGAESDRDEAFVASLASKYGVDYFIKKFDTNTIAVAQKKSIETTARDLRYQWFEALATTQQQAPGSLPNYTSVSISQQRTLIVTAHHADDNIETVVMNFFRGTGIAGIRGIQPKQGRLIRPLLFARRKELEEFVQENQLSFVTDHSNFENDYTRNYFRNEVLKQVRQVYPAAENNVLHNIARFADTEVLYRQAIQMHKKKLVEQKGNEFHIPVLKLQKAMPLQTILYEIIQEYGFTAHQLADAMELLHSDTGKYIQSATHRLIKNRNWLIIAPNETAAAHTILIEADTDTIFFNNGQLKMRRTTLAEHRMKHSPLLAQLDINTISFPLILRRWKQGDYFYPLGMEKKKKLSRFFIDRKLSLTEKENTWVIEMNKKIIWVVGMRIDNRFKISSQTQQLLLIEFVKKTDG